MFGLDSCGEWRMECACDSLRSLIKLADSVGSVKMKSHHTPVNALDFPSSLPSLGSSSVSIITGRP